VQKDSPANILIFSSAVAFVCAIVLSITAVVLQPEQERNVALDIQKNILKVLGALEEAEEKGDVVAYFEENVKKKIVDSNGKVYDMSADESSKLNFEKQKKAYLAAVEAKDDAAKAACRFPVYQMEDASGNVTGVAIPVIGKGLWSTLRGYFALEDDLSTVAGITFYDEKETPGLGAEIKKPWFQANFIGKKIYDENGTLTPIKVVKGKAADKMPDKLDHAVDGIQGATITCDGVNKMLVQDLGIFQPYLKTLAEAK
jgi:Na+-transporting NADH:ubiquinone oxidoreductase subunit C